MGNYQKVSPGSDLEIPAECFNNWQAAAAACGITSGAKGRSVKGNPRNGTVILVQNVSGSTANPFNALRLKEPVVPPEDGSTQDSTAGQTSDFKSRVCLKADTPAEAGDAFCVLLEPLPDQAFGYAIVSGATPCWINLAASGDKAVDVDPGQTVPKSGTAGQTILWVKGGVGTAATTGPQWAVILLGGSAASLPTPQYQDMVGQGVAENTFGYDWVHTHAMES